ncbi:hypothetical protein DU500_12785 [Haloplanus rubicundus]|uniref:Uncharacterized protein n=1 Tax=Haloplanus rubicundus TaxID=1547898 RepID=A0A345E4V4_9EURY|nr:hypothetical protein [Haloplanus rubicundus]AXG07226.1 hypothetical protein DU500_12785 [Haloplanus rubicundus]
MSDDLGEAVGAILGLAFGGFILLKIAAEVNSAGPVNIAAWGAIFMIAAALAAVLLGYGIVRSVVS